MNSERKTKIICRLIGAVFLLFATPPLLFGLWTYSDSKSILETGLLVSGEVMEVVELGTGDGRRAFAPRIRYKDHHGEQHEFTGSSTKEPNAYSVGDEVPLLYNPVHPDDVRPKEFVYIWLAPAIGFGLAGVIILFSLFIAFLAPIILLKLSGFRKSRSERSTRRG